MDRFIKETIFDKFGDSDHIRIHDDNRLRKVEKRRKFKFDSNFNEFKEG